MNAHDKYKKVFGQIKTLAESVSWSTGLSNMLEWLTWDTSNVLGITKTMYRKQIIELSNNEAVRDEELGEKLHYVTKKINAEIAASERLNRYAAPTSSIASAREVLRRAKYYSEDYPYSKSNTNSFGDSTRHYLQRHL
jgi:hypothetical protein